MIPTVDREDAKRMAEGWANRRLAYHMRKKSNPVVDLDKMAQKEVAKCQKRL